MKLGVVAVGKLRDKAVLELCETYVKRCQPFAPLQRLEVRDTPAAWDRAQKLGGPVVLLDERGEQVSSPELAGWLEDWRGSGTKAVSFVIGGADGFRDDDRDRADRLLALSRMTLPHRLAQLMLVEQLYRAATLLAGHPYHHA